MSAKRPRGRAINPLRETADPDVARLLAARPSRSADIVSHALHPVSVASALLGVVGWTAAGLPGLAWAAAAAALCAVLPLLVILAMVRAGLLDDAQVVRRVQRGRSAIVGIAAQLIGLVALASAGAPRPVLALVVSMLAGVAAIGALSVVMKASLHVAVVAGSVPVLAQVAGWIPTLLAGFAVPVVAWARVRAGRHTVAQAFVGVVLGVVVAGGVFTALV